MGEKVFMQGNQALAEAAIRAGCKLFCGYPITPSSEVAEYFARAMVERPEEGITYIQAETEVSAFNMIAGAACAGHRAMTATSGPGFDLGQEAMSYMCGGDLAGVIVDVMRPGPGDADIMASQADYYQVTRGGGHGDYRTLVYAPYSVQELCDYMQLSFEKAQEYCNPVVLVSDGNLSKLKESVDLPDYTPVPDPQSIPNVLRGCGKTRPPHKVRTGCTGNAEQTAYAARLQAKFKRIEENEVRYERYNVEDADVVLVAWGALSRVCISAMKLAREEGLKVGMIRPITLWPYPSKAFDDLNGKQFLVVEMNAGQMIDDVKLSVENKHDVHLFNTMGTMLPNPYEVLEAIRKVEVK